MKWERYRIRKIPAGLRNLTLIAIRQVSLLNPARRTPGPGRWAEILHPEDRVQNDICGVRPGSE